MRCPIRLLTTLFLLLPRAAGSGDAVEIEAYLGSEMFEACGLHRLEPEELAQLALYLAPPDLPSFEIDAALSYLENDGWEPLTLYSGVKVEPERSFSDVRHLAFVQGRRLILEKTFYSDPILPPGRYLAQVGPFSVELLDVYGRKQRLDIEND